MRWAVFVVLLMLPVAQGAINQDYKFETQTSFTESLSNVEAVVSGEVDFHAPAAVNGSLWLGAEAFGIANLERVCWQEGSSKRCEEGSMSIRVMDDSSVAFRHPGSYEVEYTAAHALSFFIDASAMFGESRPENTGFGPSMLSIPVDGVFTIPSSDDIPLSTLSFGSNFNDLIDEFALLLTMTATSDMTVYQGGVSIATISGDGEWVAFQGNPVFDDVSAAMIGVPTPIGSLGEFTPAGGAAAAEGLSIEHIDTALASLTASEGQADASQLEQVEDIVGALSGILNGAFIAYDADPENGTGTSLDGLDLIRFNKMSMSRSDDQLTWSGSGPLQIQSGQVAGADPLLLGIFPWWSLLLWAGAIAAWVVRAVKNPSKNHETWDKFGWIGWIGGAVASLLVFWFWDMETNAVWGTSLMSGDASGTGYAVVAIIQIIPLMLAGFVIGLPVRSLIKSGGRLAGQGQFMRIGAIIAPFAVLLLGAPLLIDYLEMMLDLVGKYAPS